MIEQGYKSVNNDDVFDVGYNEQLQFVESLMRKQSTATLVKVVAVNNTLFTVNVQPLVHQVDGFGKPIPHGVIYGIPYCRTQGGLNAIIIDPVAGDIGLCVFCHNDISNVKKNKSPSLPGSYRRNDWSDGVYVCGLLNQAPTQYIKIDDAGITINTPNNLMINASQTIFIGDVIANGKRIDQTHTHTTTTNGNPTSPVN